VLLPKTESATHLQLLDRLLQENGKHAQLVGLIESARAMRELSKIVVATPRLVALMLGAADLSADLGCSSQAPNLTHARVTLVEACATAGIQAIDSPFFDLNDAAGLQRETTLAVDMGFSGKAAIHPAQVPVIRQAFTPSSETIAEARAVLLESQHGVGQVNGRMVDEAVARKARRVLAAAGLFSPEPTSNPSP
jgi:(S)-citramalyl-CoA lyase